MTNERARTELEQLYMSLSEEKKKALDVAFKAMEQADNIPVMYYPQVDGITPTVVAQADGEYISKSDMIDWLKDIRSRIKPQGFHTASEFEIAENQIWNLIQMLQMGAFPTVAIPSVDMFSDLKAEISMYENSEQSIDEMIQGIKSIISIYER